MLKWAFIFLIISLIAGVLGLPQIAALSSEVSKFLFFLFLVMFFLVLLLALTIFR
jgi:uncharacterized membrane protein YtjA (UPF0391 family)